MTSTVVVAGVGMIPFVKPSVAEPYTQMGSKAIRLALRDAAVSYDQVQQVYAGYVFADTRARGRSKARFLACNTTSASAVPAS